LGNIDLVRELVSLEIGSRGVVDVLKWDGDARHEFMGCAILQVDISRSYGMSMGIYSKQKAFNSTPSGGSAMLRTIRLPRSTRIPRFQPSIRLNSTHHHHHEHSHQPQVPQGDGSVRTSTSIESMYLTPALMSPGMLTTFAWVGILYALYLGDRKSAATDPEGQGPISKLVDYLVNDGMDPALLDGKLEEARQRTLQHYRLRQRPIHRLSYPEYD
jgi:hypothetical protein